MYLLQKQNLSRKLLAYYFIACGYCRVCVVTLLTLFSYIDKYPHVTKIESVIIVHNLRWNQSGNERKMKVVIIRLFLNRVEACVRLLRRIQITKRRKRIPYKRVRLREWKIGRRADTVWPGAGSWWSTDAFRRCHQQVCQNVYNSIH